MKTTGVINFERLFHLHSKDQNCNIIHVICNNQVNKLTISKKDFLD